MSDRSVVGRELAVDIDTATLQQHVDALGAIGTHPEGGLFRTLYTPAWQEAVALVRTWLEQQGLQTRTDAVGNLFGRLPGTESDRVVLSGSHIDTVKQGGRYDGALGIHAALAAIGALQAAYGHPRKSLEVFVSCEEEGSRFHCNFWGSRALTGTIQPGEVDTIRDDDGVTIGAAMQARGLDPAAIPGARRADVDAFLELHIEQGGILEQAGEDVGLVHTITGMYQVRVDLSGRQDHAGTTPMDLRRDALAGAAEMIARIGDAATTMGRPAVATAGTIDARPGAVNIVPGACSFTIDTRHPEAARGLELRAAIDAIVRDVAARRGLGVVVEGLLDHDPVPMATTLRERLEAAARAERLRYRTMPSGAGHDSQITAPHFPTAMVFVPSRDGRSHCPEEYTPLEQIIPGVRVLARALYDLAY